jgi:hypothetical protein
MPNGHGVSPSIGNARAGKSTLDVIVEAGGSGGETRSDLANPIPPRKSSLPLKWRRPYRKPTLVGWDESPKVIETTLVKELSNLAP